MKTVTEHGGPAKRRSELERSLPPQWILRPSAHFGTAGGPAESADVGMARPRLHAQVDRQRGSRQRPSALTARLTAWAGLLAAVALPVVAWHSTIADVASRFHASFGYLVTGWSGYLLIAIGLAMLVPVAASVGREHVAFRARSAYLSWGVVLYLLGLALASQVAALAA